MRGIGNGWGKFAQAAMALVVAVVLAPLPHSAACAEDLHAGDANLSAQEEAAFLMDGTYAVEDLSAAVMSMYHFDAVAARVVVRGDDAWLVTSIDGVVETSTFNRFDGMAYGKQTQILDSTDETNHTLVAGTPVATVIERDNSRTFVLPVDKDVLAAGGDIYYIVKYKAGYNSLHDGDWLKSKSGDYYLTGYKLRRLSSSTVLPCEETSESVKLSVANNAKMFRVSSASVVENSDGSSTLTMTLSGAGYQYLFKGTYEQAVANGSATENWIGCVEVAGGYCEFQIPISADETHTSIPVVAVSQIYYNGFLKGVNSIERSFYPRQINLDLTKATLVTDDFSATQEIAVTKEQGLMFAVMPTSTLTTSGGPNSNGYSSTLVLTMDSSSFDKAYLGSAEDAAKAADSDIVQFNSADKTFSLKVMWMETAGKPETVKSYTDGTPFVASFFSAKNQKWYERAFRLDAEAGTLEIFSTDDCKAAKDVDELIAKIQIQERIDTTDTDCKAAKDAWDALTDAQKALVEEADYFGLDTGDASKDDPLNQDGIGANEILVVSFGTSYNDSRVATVGGVEKAIKAAFPDWSVRRAFTSQIVINHIQARDGEKIDNMNQALKRAVANGVKNLVITPTHLMHGAEYDELIAALEPYQSKMTITYAEPLLGEVGADATVINADKEAVAKAVVDAACKDSGYADAAAAAADGAAIVLMGHGTAHAAKVTYLQMQTVMDELGYRNVFVGTVEGEPESTSCENVIAAVKDKGYKKAYLRPLMVVAGDHANNDMADPEDSESWYSQFVASGAFDSVTCQIAGLAEIEAVQQLYVNHTAAAIPQISVEAPVVITDLVYNGKEQVGVIDGTGFSVQGGSAMDAGNYTATATLINGYVWADGSMTPKAIIWSIAPGKSTIKLTSQSRTFTGKPVSYSGKVTKKGSEGPVSYKYYSDSKATKEVAAKGVRNVAAYYVKATVAADKNHEAATSDVAKLTIKRAGNDFKVKPRKATHKVRGNKGKNTVIAAKKAFRVARNASAGKVTYSLKSVPKKAKGKITVSRSGKVTVKKGLARGTYTVKVKARSAKTANYKSATSTVRLKVKVV